VTEITENATKAAPESLSCMEVWGGNSEAETSFSLPGLDVWVSSHRHGRPTADCGDVHYLSSCASGRITRMLLAEVCGQRTVSQQLAGQLRGLMMRNINAIGQSRFIRQMHEELREFSDRGGFATAIISTYFAPQKTFTLCNAGHPAPLIFRANKGEWAVMKMQTPSITNDNSTPLGVVDQGEYQQFSTQLDEGDMVLSFSNALTECRDQDGHTIGTSGVSRHLAQTDVQNPAKLISDLISRIFAWDPAAAARNDTTLLLCRATAKKVGWKNNLMAPLRLFGSVTDKTTIH
jgi:sigma-B regulation protein RsbU (phosphoserine phosphatase)